MALAVTPAICEETLFRGALLRSLSSRHRGLSVAVSALCFGAFHFSLYKFFPTAALGLGFSLLAVRSGSIVPSVIAHALNNALVLALVRAGFEDELPSGGTATTALLLIAGALALMGGLWIAGRPSGSGVPDDRHG